MYKNRYSVLVFLVFVSICSIRAAEEKETPNKTQDTWLKEQLINDDIKELYKENAKEVAEKIYRAAVLKDTVPTIDKEKSINTLKKYQVDQKNIDRTISVLDLFYPSQNELDELNNKKWNKISDRQSYKFFKRDRFKALRDFIEWFVSDGYGYKRDYMINEKTLQPIFKRYEFGSKKEKTILNALGWWRQDGWFSQVKNSDYYNPTIKALAILTISTVGITLGIAGFRKFFPEHFSRAYALIKTPFLWHKPLSNPYLYRTLAAF